MVKNMPDYVVTAFKNQSEPIINRANIGETQAVSVDFRPWSEDQGAGITITSAAWTVLRGTATVSGAALASNVASANVAFPESGRNLIQVSVTDGAIIKKIYLETMVYDPTAACGDDYEV